ncbi:MAG: zinc-binding dehydrogenase [Clostridia bacterium]|nr:zinc-binding dehydrogenase [Clostridia bacterium]MBQ5802026.1 zinc-binding dehydrogenase [Clostridia bacterium]
MKQTMKAITVYGPYDARMEIVPKPEATGDMIVAKVCRTGVCATDTSIYTGDSSFIRSGEIKYPCRFGHEWAGIVEAVGPEVKNFKPGDRIYTDNFVTCGKCEACQTGDYMSCPSIWSVGTVNCWDGCYAEYMQMPERHCFHLPEELSMDEGALIEPASIAYDAFRGVTLTEKDTVVVYGTGAIGMISAWLAKYYGAGRVILVGRTEEKLQIALQIGADFVINSRKEDAIAAVKKLSLGGKGANMVIETSGSPQALKDGMACAARYARISVVSFYERNIDDIAIDPLVLGCFAMVGAAGRYGNAPEVCEIMRKNPVKLTPVVSHHIPFDKTLEMFENDAEYRKTRIKAIITFDE